MGQLTININYPDAKQDDIIEALRMKFGKKNDDTDWSPAELVGLWKDHMRDQLRDAYTEYVRIPQPIPDADDITSG